VIEVRDFVESPFGGYFGDRLTRNPHKVGCSETLPSRRDTSRGGGKTQVALAKVAGGKGPKPMQDNPMVVSDIGAGLPICLLVVVRVTRGAIGFGARVFISAASRCDRFR
jgi:hypothetical protein